MINTKKLLKVSAIWVSILYIACYALVGGLPGLRPGFMMYGLHMNASLLGNYGLVSVFTIGNFIGGLVIWLVITLLSVWLFAGLWNKMIE